MMTITLPEGHLFQFGDAVMIASQVTKRRDREASRLEERLFGQADEKTCEKVAGNPPFFTKKQWVALRKVTDRAPRKWFCNTVVPRFYELVDWRDRVVNETKEAVECGDLPEGTFSDADIWARLDGELKLLIIAMNQLLADHDIELEIEGAELGDLPAGAIS